MPKTATPGCVYVTTDTAIIAEYKIAHKARDEWLRSFQAWAKDVTDIESATIGYVIDWNGNVSVECVYIPFESDLPDGWRVDSKNKSRIGKGVVPDRRKAKGRELCAAMFDLNNKTINPINKLVGMPNMCFVADSVCSPGVSVLSDDRLEVSWSYELDEDSKQPDPAVWSKMPLSQWHARNEAEN